jgi:hypothetical protein
VDASMVNVAPGRRFLVIVRVSSRVPGASHLRRRLEPLLRVDYSGS